MKIAYCSDLHLEFYHHGFHQTRIVSNLLAKHFTPPKFPEKIKNSDADVLLLAGDIVPFSDFLQIEFHDDFFKYVSEQYKDVIWIPGNHEWWGSLLKGDVISQVQEKLLKLGATNIHLTECGTFNIGGVMFLATTLWTNLNKNCPIASHEIMFGMNDYREIKTDAFGGVSSIIPEDTYLRHVAQHKFLEDNLSDAITHHKNTPIVVVTHHTPSYESIPQKYRQRFTQMNYAYFSDLEYMGAINPMLKYWIHGHCHDSVCYDMLGVKVISNPHGYYPKEVLDHPFSMQYIEV